jgi:L-fuculose-phosphate aldolase
MAFRRALNLEEAATYRCLVLGDTTTGFPPEALADLRHGRP